jgi:XTP/dITP diphosphohydrolase
MLRKKLSALSDKKINVIVATNNPDKFKEICSLLKPLPKRVNLLSLRDLQRKINIKENGKSLQENALKKSITVCKKFNLITLADDSGLEVPALNNAPGVYSSRFAGYGCTYEDNNRKLLKLLEGVPKNKRKAQFRCVICISVPDKQNSKNIKTYFTEGKCKGYISEEMRGSYGFGYDPVFVVPKYKKTFGELGPEVKNKISHRAIAVKKARKILINILKNYYNLR